MRFFLIGAALAASAFSQPNAAFEAASVKPTDPNIRAGMDFRVQPGGRLTISNLTLETILCEAYHIQQFQISGGPSWMSSDHFDIIAKADGEPSRDQMMKMLQALLAERFKMSARMETKEGAVYNLVVAKNGPKLSAPANTAARPAVRTYRTGDISQPGLTLILKGENAPIDLLIPQLSANLHRPVIDRTGLKGAFDFKVEYAWDESRLDIAPALGPALQDQMGLRLESAKGPVEMLVVDHAEKPSEN